MIYIFSKAGANYERIDLSGNYTGWKSAEKPSNLNLRTSVGNIKKWVANENKGTRCVLSVLSNLIKKNHNKDTHPTEKPIELYKFLIERYSKEGDTVLDPTFGSGNSGLACRELKRKYIGIEKNKEFFDKFNAKINLVV
jgi:DNA modification methylase